MDDTMKMHQLGKTRVLAEWIFDNTKSSIAFLCRLRTGLCYHGNKPNIKIYWLVKYLVQMFEIYSRLQQITFNSIHFQLIDFNYLFE